MSIGAGFLLSYLCGLSVLCVKFLAQTRSEAISRKVAKNAKEEKKGSP